MKTEKTYFHNGKFWYLEGDGWPERPDPNKTEYTADGKTFAYSYPIATQQYQQSLSSSLSRAIEFEDKQKIEELISMSDGYFKCVILEENTVYSFPEQEVEIVVVDAWLPYKRVAR